MRNQQQKQPYKQHPFEHTIGEDSSFGSIDEDLNEQRRSYYDGQTKAKNFEDTVNDLFDKAMNGLNTIMDAGVRVGKKAYDDYRIRSSLNFKILDDLEVETLVNDHHEYYRSFVIDLLMLFGGISAMVSLPLVAFSNALILFVGLFSIAIFGMSIYRLIKDSCAYRRSIAPLRGKTVQITPKAEHWIKQKEIKNRNNLYKSIAFMLVSIIAPCILLVGIMTLLSFDVLIIIWMIAYLMLVGLSTGLMVYYTGMNTLYKNIIDHRRFR